MSENPSLPDTIEACVTRRLRGVHTAAFGTISAHSDSVCTVTLTQAIDGVIPEPIQECPVVIAGDWQDGDPCLAVFTEETFSTELAGTDDTKRHGLNAVCVPLVARPGQSTDFVALAAEVLDRLTTLQVAFDAHTHAVATTGTAAAQTGTAAPVASPVGPLASVAATRLRAR